MVTEKKMWIRVRGAVAITMCLLMCAVQAQSEAEEGEEEYGDFEFDADYGPDTSVAEPVQDALPHDAPTLDTSPQDVSASVKPGVPIEGSEPEEVKADEVQDPEASTSPVAQDMQETDGHAQDGAGQHDTELPQVAALPEPEIGIDTRNLAEGQGNWLFKRIWWERAEQKYETIRKYVESVFEARTLFLAQRADLDKNVLDPFYIEIGLGQVELRRITNALIQYLERERTEKGSLDPNQVKILQELRKEENTLKKVKRDIDGIGAVNQQINESLNILLEQINKVRTYEREAWKHFKKIARVLSDIEARTLYYEMDIIAKNIVDIQAYISQDFATYFGELDSMLKDLVNGLEDALESLKEKGLDLNEQLEQLERKPEPCVVVIPKEEPQEEEKQEGGFLDNYILAPVSSIFSGIGSMFHSLYALVAGESAVSDPQDADVSAP